MLKKKIADAKKPRRRSQPNYLRSVAKASGGVCMLPHQTEFIEVGKEPPGVDIRQAVPQLQVGQRG